MLKNFPLAVRIIAGYLIAASVVYAAEVFPYTGIFLMFIFGAFWVSVILNVMLLHLAFAAATKDIPRTWLFVPLVAYGAWFGFYTANAIPIDRKIKLFEAENRIDSEIPADLDLVFDDDARLFAISVKEIVVGGPVFVGDHEIAFTNGDPEACMDKSFRNNFNYWRTPVPDYDDNGCIVFRRAATPLRSLRFRQTVHVPYGSQGNEQTVYSIELDDGNSTARSIGRFGFGTIQKMSPWPLYLVGCALDSSKPSWACFHGPLTRTIHYGVSSQPANDGDLTQDSNWNDYRATALATLLNRPARRWISKY